MFRVQKIKKNILSKKTQNQKLDFSVWQLIKTDLKTFQTITFDIFTVILYSVVYETCVIANRKSLII